MEWAKKMNFGRSSAIGNNLEPAKTSANIIRQTILSPPFSWWWNSTPFTFTCVVGQQDYVVAAPTFAYIDNASVQDPSSLKWTEIETKMSLSLDSIQGRPRFVCPLNQNSATGDVTFRLMPAPDKLYNVSILSQLTPTLFAGTADSWAPIPDYMSYIYNWGFLALMWMFADDPRWTMANQKFVAHILGASEGLDETQRNIFLNNWNSLTQGQVMAIQQGTQARGV